MILLAVLLCFLRPLTSASSFAVHQATLWQDSTIAKTAITHSITSYPFTYPLSYNSTYIRSLIFSGFSINSNFSINFEVDISMNTSSTDIIVFRFWGDMWVYYLSFEIVLVDKTCSWLWIETGGIFYSKVDYYPLAINQFYNNITLQPFDITLSRTILNTTTIKVYPFISSFNSTGINYHPQSTIYFLSLSTTTAQLRADRNYHNSIVQRLKYVVIIVNAGQIKDNYYGRFARYKYAINFGQDTMEDQFASREVNFGIKQTFMSKLGTFQQNCLMGIYMVRVYFEQESTVYVNMTTNPISTQFNLITFTLNNPRIYTRTEYNILCVLEYYFDAECQTLHDFRNCKSCSQNQCFQCQAEFVLVKGECNCMLGAEVMGICTTIQGCVQPVLGSQGDQVCLTCNQTYFHSLPINNQCQCLNGTLINGICNTISGCIVSTMQNDGSISCYFCNVVDNFQGKVVNGQCICKEFYELSGEKCEEICGDGKLFSQNSSKCDDGNVLDGDGCNSKCQVEQYYHCSIPDPVSSSTCSYNGIPINISLGYSQRNSDENQGNFVFTLNPTLLLLEKIDYMNSILLNCDSQFTINFVRYNKGELTISFEYTEDMEGVNCNLNLTFDSAIANIEASEVNFTAISRNQKLLLADKTTIESKRTVGFIFKILSYVVLTLFVLSLGHKMIGLELIVTCQSVYYSYLLYEETPFVGSAIKDFSLIIGPHKLFHQDSYNQIIYPYTARLELSRQFTENTFILLAIAIFVSIFLVLFKIYSNFKKDKFIRQRQIEIPGCEVTENMKYGYHCLLFPTVGFSLILMTLTGCVGSVRTGISGSFDEMVNSLCIVIGWIIAAIVIGIQGLLFGGILEADKLAGTYQLKKWYIPLFLTRTLTLSLLYSLSFWLPFITIIILIFILEIIYLFIIIFGLPYYTKCFSTLTIIFYQMTSLYCLSAVVIYRVFQVSSSTEILIWLAMEGLLVLTCVFCAIRIFKHYMLYWKKEGKNMKADLNEQKRKIPDAFEEIQLAIRIQRQKIQAKNNPYSLAPFRSQSTQHLLSQRPSKVKNSRLQRVQEEQEDQQLQKIKQRHKIDLSHKRKQTTRKVNETPQ